MNDYYILVLVLLSGCRNSMRFVNLFPSVIRYRSVTKPLLKNAFNLEAKIWKQKFEIAWKIAPYVIVRHDVLTDSCVRLQVICTAPYCDVRRL